MFHVNFPGSTSQVVRQISEASQLHQMMIFSRRTWVLSSLVSGSGVFSPQLCPAKLHLHPDPYGLIFSRKFTTILVPQNTWIFLLCVKFVPKFTLKTYQQEYFLHIWKIQVLLKDDFEVSEKDCETIHTPLVKGCNTRKQTAGSPQKNRWFVKMCSFLFLSGGFSGSSRLFSGV